ncbi:hypothetical protein ES708_03917 [subsurface metagenome]
MRYIEDAKTNIKKSTSKLYRAKRSPKTKLNIVKLDEYRKNCFSKIIFQNFLSDLSLSSVSIYLYFLEHQKIITKSIDSKIKK